MFREPESEWPISWGAAGDFTDEAPYQGIITEDSGPIQKCKPQTDVALAQSPPIDLFSEMYRAVETDLLQGAHLFSYTHKVSVLRVDVPDDVDESLEDEVEGPNANGDAPTSAHKVAPPRDIRLCQVGVLALIILTDFVVRLHL